MNITDTRGTVHTITAKDVEGFQPAVCPLRRPCVEVIYEGESIFADCTISQFVQAWEESIKEEDLKKVNRMTYEAFRIGYQDSEQAARAAYQLYEAALLQRDTLKAELTAKIDLALDALNLDAGQWSDKSRDRHLIEQIELAKQHLRCHDQAALNAVKAVAVLDFVNHIIGAYEAGFVDTPTLTLFDLYQTARNHVKDGYITITPGCHEVWGEELAEELKGGEA